MKTRMHNGSRLLSLLLAVVLVFTLTVPALAADKPQDMNLRIAVMSDLHYFSPDMIADTADFEHALNSDRKLLKESSAILYEKFEQVRADKPDILLVSGDLTKDGEQECHAALAKQLQQLQQDVPGLKIYVINGNHDIRNYNAKNFNTPDGKAVPATRTHPEDFKRIYDFVYSDPTVIATFTPAAGNEAGSLSYVARPVEGLTIIAMDTCRYSKENTSNGTDEHETSGAISADLEKWVIEQTAAAKARGDLVVGLEHHGLVPHFDVEPTILPMYLVNGYERIAQEYADAGMSVVFTGHMHAVDIAAMTTKAGNTFYDIETGSALTYPCPIRFVDLRRSTVGGETNTYMSVSTKTHDGPINYTDPATGTAHVIDDLTEYAREFGFSTDMLKTVAGDFVKSSSASICRMTPGRSRRSWRTSTRSLTMWPPFRSRTARTCSTLPTGSTSATLPVRTTAITPRGCSPASTSSRAAHCSIRCSTLSPEMPSAAAASCSPNSRGCLPSTSRASSTTCS